MKKTFLDILSLFKVDSTRVFILFSFILLILEYFGWQGPFHQLFRDTQFYRQIDLNDRHFYAQVHTSISFIILFVLLPMCYHFMFPMRDSDYYGLKLTKSPTNKVYLVLGLVMVPIVYIASMSPNFYQFYPLYRPQALTDWALFELVYMSQFFCVEFFFRGFGIFRLRRIFKDNAIVIMVLPYALIHIHKPFPEAIGSIFAGLVLGHLSLKGKSIWPGVLLHMLIAISADVFGLYHSGWFN